MRFPSPRQPTFRIPTISGEIPWGPRTQMNVPQTDPQLQAQFTKDIMAAKPAASEGIAKESAKGNGLLLYCHANSFYSQKVVMALHEKKLPFKSKFINLTKGEQNEPPFLQLNPKGEVPVLKDGVKIIPDSSRILDYLEDNFSNGDGPRLIPNDLGSQVKQKVLHYRNLLDALPIAVITMGSLYHPQDVKNPKMPFIQPIRKILINAENNRSKNLREKAQVHQEYSDILLEKARNQEIRHQKIISQEEYREVLRQVDLALDKVEKELISHNVSGNENLWLACQRFTAADISLTILLERLHRLGLSDYFWEVKRPNIKKYYLRVQERESYKKTIPSTIFHLQTFLNFQNPLALGVGIIATLAVIIGGVFYYRRVKLR